ncbi:hypothetical protein Mapa_005023 [Marchantia paleacea]|nr:hypothetical protein Mapa_005023 [Marchantia paleacea]
MLSEATRACMTIQRNLRSTDIYLTSAIGEKSQTDPARRLNTSNNRRTGWSDRRDSSSPWNSEATAREQLALRQGDTETKSYLLAQHS